MESNFPFWIKINPKLGGGVAFQGGEEKIQVPICFPL